jgi:hypothetical protein
LLGSLIQLENYGKFHYKEKMNIVYKQRTANSKLQ